MDNVGAFIHYPWFFPLVMSRESKSLNVGKNTHAYFHVILPQNRSEGNELLGKKKEEISKNKSRSEKCNYYTITNVGRINTSPRFVSFSLVWWQISFSFMFFWSHDLIITRLLRIPAFICVLWLVFDVGRCRVGGENRQLCKSLHKFRRHFGEIIPWRTSYIVCIVEFLRWYDTVVSHVWFLR